MIKAHKENLQGCAPARWDPSREPTLSWRAKGILYYLLLKPYFWVGQVRDIVKQGPDSAHLVRKAIKELADAGYVKRVHNISEDGKFTGSHYEYSDKPIFKK